MSLCVPEETTFICPWCGEEDFIDGFSQLPYFYNCSFCGKDIKFVVIRDREASS